MQYGERRTGCRLRRLRQLGIVAAGATSFLLASAASASAVLTLDTPPVSISAVDQHGTEINIPLIDYRFGTDGFSAYTGPAGGQSYAYLQGGDGIVDRPIPIALFLNTDVNCNPEEAHPQVTIDAQRYCWEIDLTPVGDVNGGAFGPIVPLTATSGTGSPLVFDHWSVKRAAAMRPVLPRQTVGGSGYCRSGDRGLLEGGVAYQSYINVDKSVGSTTSYQAAYTKPSPDTSPPVIEMDQLLDCATFEQGSDESAVGRPAVYNFGCTDPGYGSLSGPTGVASCAGTVNGSPVPDGGTIDTSTPGDYTLTVTARDGAGNVRTMSATYHVVPVAVTSVTAPPTLTGGAFEIGFSRPVDGIDSSSFEVKDSSGAPVAGSMLCLSATRTKVKCLTGQVRFVQLRPAAPLPPGERYQVILDGAKRAAILDQNGFPVADMVRTVQAQNVFGATAPQIAYAWSTIDELCGPFTLAIPQEKFEGATVKFSIGGTQLDLETWNGPDHGKAKVRITTPGQPATTHTIDTYAPSADFHTYTWDGLVNGNHDVTITVLGTKQAASSDTLVGILGYGSTDCLASGAMTESWSPIFGYTFASLPGAAASFTFNGTAVAWNALVGPNDGEASVTIDGSPVAREDLYAPGYSFQDFTYTGLAQGTHTITITALGTRNPASSDTVVTLNSLTVL